MVEVVEVVEVVVDRILICIQYQSEEWEPGPM